MVFNIYCGNAANMLKYIRSMA